MKIRLIAIDMDGTLLNRQNTLSETNRRVLQQAIDRGVLAVPATGRQFSGLPPELKRLRGLRYFLCSNGAVVYDRIENRILHQELMSPELAVRVLEKLEAYPCFTDLYLDGKAYTSAARYQQPLQFGISKVHLRTFLKSRIPVKNLRTFLQTSKKPIEKLFSIFPDDTERQRFWKELESWPEIALTSSAPNCAEITSAAATKGHGLQKLASLLNLSRDSILAIGDGYNDLTMLKWAGTGIAMANAPEPVRRCADAVTSDCDEDGLAAAIQRYVLSSAD